MNEAGFVRLTVFTIILGVTAVAGLVLTGLVKSRAILGGAVLIAVAAIAFELGFQYQEQYIK